MITVQVRGLDRALANARNAPKQVRFAATLAINQTAKIVQQHSVTRLLPEKFTLRSRGAPWFKPGTKLGFNINFAKRAQPQPTAVIGSRADWLELQEQGGVKDRPTTIAIPTLFHKQREEILARAKRPKAIARLMQRRNQRITKIGEMLASGVDEEGKRLKSTGKRALRGERQRTERGQAVLGSAGRTPFYLPGFKAGDSGHTFPPGWWVRTGATRLPIRPLFFFYETTKIPPVLQFIGTETKLASAELPRQFEIALRKALATAK